jgi:hypothetical protein
MSFGGETLSGSCESEEEREKGERAEERRIAKLVIKLLLTIPLVLLVFTCFFFINFLMTLGCARAAL